jgi:hypothetical protein
VPGSWTTSAAGSSSAQSSCCSAGDAFQPKIARRFPTFARDLCQIALCQITLSPFCVGRHCDLKSSPRWLEVKE